MDILAANVLGSLAMRPDPGGAALSAPDSLAAAQFSQIMQVPPSAAVDAAAPAVITPAPADLLDGRVAGAPKSLGDTILSGMQNLSQEFQQSWKTVNAVLDQGSSMTTSDMLKLQMGLTQMSIQYELVGKAISRSTQNLDQLVKMQ